MMKTIAVVAVHKDFAEFIKADLEKYFSSYAKIRAYAEEEIDSMEEIPEEFVVMSALTVFRKVQPKMKEHALTPVSYTHLLENSDEAAKPRLPLDVVLKEEKYHTDGEEEQIRAYDEVIRQYYIDRTDGKRDETWSMQMADFVEKPQRPFLKEVLGKQGFLLK